jgi:ribosomal-protein-alanine N-acetyltransferase
MKTVITTARLQLRPFTLDDAEAFAPLASLPEVIRYVGNTPAESLEQVREGMREGPLQDYENYGYGRFAVIWKESGRLIGFSGLKYLPELQETELGYRLLPEFWGQGLATESALASLDFARDTLKLKRLIGIVHPDNAGSSKVMQKMGFSMQRQVRMDFIPGVDLNIFARDI